MRVLVISSNRVGDAVITCGALDEFIHRHPGCRLTIACGPAAEGVFARMPNRERTILVPKRRYDLHWLDLWRQVVGTLWDLVIDFRGSAMAWVVPTRRRAVRRPGSGPMHAQHAALLGISPAPLPVTWTDAADHARAAALLPPGPVIGLGPTANWPPKAWPAERFAELARALLAGPLTSPLAGAAVAVFGGPGAEERALAEPLLAALPEAIDLCGRLRLPETTACLQRCTLFVGNDSGLMHLAAAAETPTVGLIGPTIDRIHEMAPVGRHASWVGGRGAAMQDLSVEDALAACERALAEVRTPLPVAVAD